MATISVDALRAKLDAALPEKCKDIKRHFDAIHHMTYIATLESGQEVVVRVTYPLIRKYAGEKSPFRMSSEVATMKYVKKHTRVPVPEVLAYDPDDENAVGGEWMVMEKMRGVIASLVWPQLSKEMRRKLTIAMAGMFAQLLKLRFSKIGSLYEDKDLGFRVGPMALLPSHDKVDRKVPDPKYCGPFESQKAWLLATAKGELDLGRDRPLEGNDLTGMQRVIRDIQVSDLLVDTSAAHCKIGLEHVDLNLTNVLVDPDFPTEITGIIDWEGARTAPMWAIQPRFFERIRKMTEVDKQELHAFAYELIRLRVVAWNAGGRDPGWGLRSLLRRAQERHEHRSSVEDAVSSLQKLTLQLDEERLRSKVAIREESPEAEGSARDT